MNLLLVREIVARSGDIYWHATSNPYLFPEPIFVAIGEAFSDDVGVVHLASYVAQLLALFVGLVVMVRSVGLEPLRLRLLTAGAIGACLYGIAVLAVPDLGHWSYLPATRGAHWPLVPLTFGLVLLALVGSPERWLRSALAAAACLTLLTFSDRVFVLWATVPCLCLVGLMLAADQSSRGRTAGCGLALGASLPLSWLVGEAVRLTGRIAFGSESYNAHLVGPIVGSWTGFIADLRSDGALAQSLGLSAGACVVAVVWLGVRIASVRRGSRANHPSERRLLMVSFLCAVSAILALVVTVLGGFWTNRHAARFLQPLLVMPILWFTAWSASGSVQRPRRLALSAFGVLLLGLAVIAHGVATEGKLDLTAGPAEDVAQLDEVVEKLGLHGGLADYWVAGTIRALSHGAIPLAPVTWDAIAPMNWGGSPDWQFEVAQLDFVVANGLDPVGLRARLGAPNCIARAGRYVLWIYGQNSVGKFREFRREALEQARTSGLQVRELWRASAIPCLDPSFGSDCISPPADEDPCVLAVGSPHASMIFGDDFETGEASRWAPRRGEDGL